MRGEGCQVLGGWCGVCEGKRELLSMCSSLHLVWVFLNLIGVHVILSAVPSGHMNYIGSLQLCGSIHKNYPCLVGCICYNNIYTHV